MPFFAHPHNKKTGEQNCEGTDDTPTSRNYGTRFQVAWGYWGLDIDGEEYYYTIRACLYGLESYLDCPGPQAGAADADPATAAAAAEARACADRDRVLGEPPEATEARLSKKFCAARSGAGVGVGRAFAVAVLATLDANGDGSVSCAEWGIAKMRPTLEQLGGAYRGPRELPLPECPMSAEGAATLARYNAHLSGLAVATTARADNLTAAGAAADAPTGR
jgi:hypothetical protein